MKFRVIALTLLCIGKLLLAQSVGERDLSTTQHKNVISVNSLFLPVGMVSLSYERAISQKSAVFIAAGYDFATKDYYEFSLYRIFMVQGQVRFYPFGKSPKGFFAGANTFFGHSHFTTKSSVRVRY